MIAFTNRHPFGTAGGKGSIDLSAGDITVVEQVSASEVAPSAAAGFTPLATSCGTSDAAASYASESS